MTTARPGALRIAAALLASLALPAHGASIITFDGLATDVALTNQFAAQGVIFNNIEASARFPLNIVAVSGPNYASPFWTGTNPGSFYFVDPADAAVNAFTDSVSITLNGLGTSHPGWFSGATIDALDLAGNVIAGQTQIIQPLSVTAPSQTITFTGQIHGLRFSNIANAQGPGVFPFDNLTFGDLTDVPEPATYGITGLLAMAIMLAARRKRQTAAVKAKSEASAK